MGCILPAWTPLSVNREEGVTDGSRAIIRRY